MMTVRELRVWLQQRGMTNGLQTQLLKLEDQNPAYPLGVTLQFLDDDTLLREIVQAFGLWDAVAVQRAHSAYVARCDGLYADYKAKIDQAYKPLLSAPAETEALLLLAIRRQDVELLRGDYQVLRPMAQDSIRQQADALRVWLAKVATAYEDYAEAVSAVVATQWQAVRDVA